LPILVSLGVWQLHRAEEKKQLENAFKSQTRSPTPLLKLSSISPALNYQTIVAQGNFDNRHLIFLDNKIYHHQIGYQVFSPFFISGTQQFLLVNRGFVGVRQRSKMPAIKPLFGTRTISGFIYFPKKMFLLKKELLNDHWPRVTQSIELKNLSSQLQAKTYPFYLLLQTGDDMDLIRDWQPVNFPAYRHTGYAIQWFSLALTLFIIFIVCSTSKEQYDTA